MFTYLFIAGLLFLFISILQYEGYLDKYISINNLQKLIISFLWPIVFIIGFLLAYLKLLQFIFEKAKKNEK